MRVLVVQQFHLGHHYHYIGHLLPMLLEVATDVHVAVTESGHRSAEFGAFLAPFGTLAHFDPILPEAAPDTPMRERLSVHRNLRSAVERVRPDYVLIPSGDAQATAMSLYRMVGAGTLPAPIPCEVGIHFGTGPGAGVKATIRDRLNGLNLALAELAQIHLVNFLFYERFRNRGRLGQRFRVMPHPVDRPEGLDLVESRRRLGLPEGGRYIGLAASMDTRKAIGEFLSAFEAASRGRDERVLLAGWMHPAHRQLIDSRFRELVRSDRLIVLEGFLPQQQYQTAISALDVVCTPYPRFAGLSSTLLEGVAAGRPILANDYGWSRAVVGRFELGWTCDIQDHRAFAGAIRTAFDRAPEYVATEGTQRLLAFHDPKNFAASWTEGICEAVGRQGQRPLSWEWVEEVLPRGRRHFR